MDPKNSAKLDLSHEGLTYQDMEIVAYYALRNNKVSQIMFARAISYIDNILTRDFFSRRWYT
jgi:hypothetical protein